MSGWAWSRVGGHAAYVWVAISVRGWPGFMWPHSGVGPRFTWPLVHMATHVMLPHVTRPHGGHMDEGHTRNCGRA